MGAADLCFINLMGPPLIIAALHWLPLLYPLTCHSYWWLSRRKGTAFSGSCTSQWYLTTLQALMSYR